MSSAYEISTDRGRLNIELIHRFLSTSYWAKNMPRPLLERAIANSMCFGAYQTDTQVGFGRVVTDYATFGYVADVFVLPEHRGKGVGRLLIDAMLKHPELAGFRRWLLATKDAHGLYEKLGFRPLAEPRDFLTIRRSAPYPGLNVD